MTEAKASLKNLKIAPRKVRLVADLIKGMHVTEALAQLDVMTQRSVVPLSKLIRSAIANAKEQEMDTDRLVIQSIRVDKGIKLKRAVPRARGRATVVEKKMSHVMVELRASDHVAAPAYTLHEKPKKEKKPREEKDAQTPKPKYEEPEKEKAKSGFKDKIFRRKSV